MEKKSTNKDTTTAMKTSLLTYFVFLLAVSIIVGVHTTKAGAGLPTNPVLSSHPTSGEINEWFTFNFNATDPDGDMIRYQADWNNDGTSDQCIPSSGYVASGATEGASYQWTTSGSKTFGIKAHDTDGNSSGWTQTTITINPPQTPTVTTRFMTLVTGTSTQLNGRVNPNGQSSAGWFRYSTTNPGTCNDTFGTRVPVSGSTALGSGSGNVDYNQPITGLTAGTDYFYCAIASSTGGIAYGAIVQKMTAASVPTGLTATPSAICSSGTINTVWNPSATAYCYQIELDGVPTCNGNSTVYNHTGLADSSAHAYRVRSNNGTYSAWSDFVYAAAPATCVVPTGNISANLTALVGGSTTTIFWTSDNASSCTVSSVESTNNDSWSGTSHRGADTSPLYEDTTYTLVCDSVAVAGVSIDVTSLPILSLSDVVVESGSDTTIEWNTSNGDEGACTLTGGPYSNLIGPTTGDPSIGSATITVDAVTTYTLTCPTGSASITTEIVPVGYEQ